MSSSLVLTRQQEAVRDFVASEWAAGRPAPSHREIARHFGFASSFAAACHLRALKKKGALLMEEGKARSLRVVDDAKRSLDPLRIMVPILGDIPAGLAEDREQGSGECIPVDVATVGFKPTRNTFALRVVGDSMIGRHICAGDLVLLEHGPEPRSGDIVAALIDRKSTLKTFMLRNGKPFLRAENPKYPDLIPSEELMIQGVFRALIRQAQSNPLERNRS